MDAPAAATNGAELGIELALQWRARAPPARGGGGAGEGAEEGAEGIVEEGQEGGAAASGVAASGALGAVPLRLVLAVACTGAELSLLVSRDDAREAEEARRRRAEPPPRHPSPSFAPPHPSPLAIRCLLPLLPLPTHLAAADEPPAHRRSTSSTPPSTHPPTHLIPASPSTLQPRLFTPELRAWGL